MQDSFFMEKLRKIQLSSIIGTKSLNPAIKLSEDHIKKSGNNPSNIRLLLEHEYPYKSGAIIHYSEEKPISRSGTDMIWSSYITMNEIKWIFSRDDYER